MWDVPMVYKGFVLLEEVLMYSAHAVAVGEASERVKREVRWRVAAAGAARDRLERYLFLVQ